MAWATISKTRDPARARRVALQAAVGDGHVNNDFLGVDMPFGGAKQSGNERGVVVGNGGLYLEIKAVSGSPWR